MKKERITSLVSIVLLLEFFLILFLWSIRYQPNEVIIFTKRNIDDSSMTGKNYSVGMFDRKSGEKKLYQSSEKICTKIKNAKACSDLCQYSLAEENSLRKEIEASSENRIAYKKPISATGKVAGLAVRAPRKISCPGYGDPSKSDTKGKHTDEDCCPDPDEWPKAGCVYDAKGYSIMLSGPAKK